MQNDFISLAAGEECYGPVIQGEGKLVGTPSVFIRTSGCNLWCSWKDKTGISYCDTPHTSIHQETPIKLSIDTLVSMVEEKKCSHVVISGGEPFLQKNLARLIEKLKDRLGVHVTVETNGTIFTETLADLISLSPKLASSGNHETRSALHNSKRLNIEALYHFVMGHDAQLKFVVNEDRDVSEIKDILTALNLEVVERRGFYTFSLLKPRLQQMVYLMPQGITVEQLNESAKIAIKYAIENNWKYTDRLHVRLFGHKRGT